MGIPDPAYHPGPSEEQEAQQAALDFQVLANEANVLFDNMAADRHVQGEKKYGPVKFMDVNTLNEAMEEVVDLANYARYTFIKLYIFNAQANKLISNQVDMLGPGSFMSNGG